MKRVYISGPISGLDRSDYLHRFQTAEDILRRRGYIPVNPTKFAPCRHPWLYRIIGYRLTLAYDIVRLLTCHAVVYLPGFMLSRGSLAERQWADRFDIADLHDSDAVTAETVYEAIFPTYAAKVNRIIDNKNPTDK